MLHIFNPDTDFALSVGRNPYTPPAKVIEVRKTLAMLPAIYAHKNDGILILDDISEDKVKTNPLFKVIQNNHINLIRLSQLEASINSFTSIEPWGWNHTLRHILVDNGCPIDMIPSEEGIDEIRRLSHRRITIPFLKEMNTALPSLEVSLPEELTSEQQVKDFLAKNKHAYFKAPWSSSGRGVVSTNELIDDMIIQWTRGSIRKQGSVMAEQGVVRSLDFATEWMVNNGNASFFGFSVFNTAVEGRYHGNLQESQQKLENIIVEKAGTQIYDVIENQKKIIDKLISPFYSGPLGIDMLIDKSGNINPCVEINLRKTMGMVSILALENGYNLNDYI